MTGLVAKSFVNLVWVFFLIPTAHIFHIESKIDGFVNYCIFPYISILYFPILPFRSSAAEAVACKLADKKGLSSSCVCVWVPANLHSRPAVRTAWGFRGSMSNCPLCLVPGTRYQIRTIFKNSVHFSVLGPIQNWSKMVFTSLFWVRPKVGRK